MTEGPRRRRRRRLVPDLLGVAAVCAVVLLGYAQFAVGGETFSTSHAVPGVVPCVPKGPCDAHSTYPLLDPEASSTQTEPWGHVVHRVLDSGEKPLWNPYQGTGAPLAADPPTAAFDPLLLAVHLHPTPLVQDMTFLVALVLIGLAAYWAARMLGTGPLAATVAGSVYGLSGWFFEYSNNEWFWTFLYLPLMIACVEWIVRSRRWLPVVLLGFAVAGMVFAGMPELYAMALLATECFAAVRLLVGPHELARGWAALRVAAGALLGLALASPAILLFAEYLPLSRNTHSPQAGLPPGTDPVSYLLNWVMPTISPALGNDHSFTRNWVGAAAAILVAAAIASPKAMRRHAGWPVLAMGVVFGVQLYGGSFVHWTKVLPYWSQINWTSFGTPVIACAVALLAAVGVEAVRRREVVRLRFAIAVTVLVVVVVTFLATADRPLALGHDVMVVGGWPLALVAATLVVVLCCWRGLRWAALLVVLVVVVELVLLAPRGFSSDRADPYPTTRWTDFLVAQTSRDQSRIFSTDGVLAPDRAGVYGLQDPRMVDALYVQRTWQYLRSFISHGLLDRFAASGLTETAPAIAANPMFDLLGIRYLVYLPGSAGPPSWSNPQYRVVYEDTAVRIFENTQALPRAFVVHDLHRVRDERSALRFLRSGNPDHFPDGSVQVASMDPSRTAVIEVADAVPRPTVEPCEQGSDRASIVDYSSTSVTIDVDAACAGMLVLTDTYYPGWTASVRGADARVYATDYAFRGVRVPAGRSRVVLRYEPGPLRTATLVEGAALLAIVAIGVLGVLSSRWWRSRRTARAPVPPETAPEPT